ncbi:regulator of RNase E activity RraA [Sporomusaceae bacterium BoRhaA]|uniref:RraA family protein n=1 Tax=Pelorhabdus rhamnosifermentans TaxID=2772457 RepID=UPI001FE66E26|nr:PilZ domain-containing protein [Pelorhabdus rhamnosifermentans]MBU2700208.1 regulator of RNase E activity RraA [Pelorhabdus rhamnosifermentans]
MSNVGLRIFMQINRPPQALIDGFAGIPVANIADNMNRMSCMDAKIRPINDVPLLGPAFTVRSRPGDNLMLHRALDLAQPGDIVVVDAQGDLTNSIMGELMALWGKKREIGGFIIDGAIRDIGALKKLGIPIYAAGVTPAGPYKDGPGEINVPVACGGVVVHPGDILVGDEDGIVVINPRDAENLLEKAKAKSRAELKTIENIANLAWDRTWVEQALEERGVVVVKENRDFPRADVDVPVKILLGEEDEHYIDAIAMNISLEGILLQAKQYLEPNSLIRLLLPQELGCIHITARVIWQQGNNFGCNFVEIPEDVRAILNCVLYYQLRLNP